MPPPQKTGPPLFLGLELATDQLRASIVDETLELVGVESVDFDTELPEYQSVHHFAVISRSQFSPINPLILILELREVYSQLQEMHIPLQWTCGSRAWVSTRLQNPAEPNFLLAVLGVIYFWA